MDGTVARMSMNLSIEIKNSNDSVSIWSAVSSSSSMIARVFHDFLVNLVRASECVVTLSSKFSDCFDEGKRVLFYDVLLLSSSSNTSNTNCIAQF